MSRDKYILQDREVVAVDLNTWAKWFETADRHVALTKGEKFVVSTVFLGVDHRFGDEGSPLLFETMVFNADDWGTGKLPEQDAERYSTIQEAEAGHAAMLKKWNVAIEVRA